mmetsp:Transcript_107351/g.148427  ORF Transcript_107351/g.148427 Transcript_107351/m.148427 type:complete len:191 (-) Transcript_107351:812-1384(-)
MKVKGDSILHIGNFEQEDKRFEVDQLVDCNVDEAKRRLFARFHSAGHLLDIAMNRAGRTDLKPTKGYHFSSGAYVEYMGNIDADKRDSLCVDLTKHCNDIIKETPADQKVFKKILPYEEGDKELVKAGGAPSYIPKDQEFRVLKLNQEDWGCPCGGTHVEHVHDIQSVNVTKIQKKGKSIRVSYTLPIPG